MTPRLSAVARVIGGITASAMRTLWFMPLTFLCGVHGFAFFAPYLVTFLAVAHLLKRRRVPVAVPVPVKV